MNCVLGCTKVFDFDEGQLIPIFFCCLYFWYNSPEILIKYNVIKFSSMLSSKSFMALALIVRPSVNFELIFLIWGTYDGFIYYPCTGTMFIYSV